MNEVSSKLISTELDRIYQESRKITDGSLASYIPELANVDAEQFSISLHQLDGTYHHRGDKNAVFTLQSISKVLVYAYALENFEDRTLYQHVGVEPSGEEFDSVIKLDKFKRPFNPMINAGAIAVTDLLISKFKDQAYHNTIQFFAKCFGRENISYNQSVFQSECNAGERNRALAYLLKNFSLLKNPVEEVLELYFKHCSIQVSTKDLSIFATSLANNGKSLVSGQRLLKPENIRNLLSVMLSCGMYTYAGHWIYEVGIPAKSGVSGGIMAIVPGKMGIASYSPKIDINGSSQRGVYALEELSDALKLHIFES